MSRPELARLRSILAALALGQGVPESGARRVLNVGCGDFPAAWTLHASLPGWTLYGLDRDGAALRQARRSAPFVRLVQADACTLPGLLRARFALILVRHPDLYRARAAWLAILDELPALLAPGGALLVTLYHPEEVELLRSPISLPWTFLLETDLAPPDLAGHDRFALVVRAPGL